MSKINTTVGMCSTEKKPIGFQFVLDGGEWSLCGSFSVAATGSVVVNDRDLSGTPTLSPAYSKLGCRLCGNRFVYQCGKCKKFICYRGTAGRLTCPVCGDVAEVPAATGKYIACSGGAAGLGGQKLPYNKRASITDSVKRDRFGNPQGSEYDLAADGSFKKYTVVVLNLCSYANFIEPEKALRRKGFDVVKFEGSIPPLSQLRTALSLPNTQLWIIADSSVHLSEEIVRFVSQFYEEGHGLYLWSDNDPYFADTNRILANIFGSSVYMRGDYLGEQVLGIRSGVGQPGIIGDHPISTGIVNFYEGITISHIEGYQGRLEPLMFSSDGQVVAAYSDRDQKRILVDGGFTRLYHKWDSAGTDRYIVNAAAWLANIERFGYDS